MSPLAKDLDDNQIVDLAAYYGRLFRGAIDPAESGRYVGIDIENIVSNVSAAGCRRARLATRCAPVGRSRPRP